MQPWEAWPHQGSAVTCCAQVSEGWVRQEDSKGRFRGGLGLPGMGTQLQGSVSFQGPCGCNVQTGRALASS